MKNINQKNYLVATLLSEKKLEIESFQNDIKSSHREEMKTLEINKTNTGTLQREIDKKSTMV